MQLLGYRRTTGIRCGFVVIKSPIPFRTHFGSIPKFQIFDFPKYLNLTKPIIDPFYAMVRILDFPIQAAIEIEANVRQNVIMSINERSKNGNKMDKQECLNREIDMAERHTDLDGSVCLSAMSISLLMALLFVHFIAIF